MSRGRRRIETSVARATQAGKLSAEAAEQCLSWVTVGTQLEHLADADLVLEAADESLAVKTEIFTRLDTVLTSNDTTLAFTTSSISVERLGAVTRRPEQVTACTSSTR